ncbi:MAG: ABC transporter substrate-binding protein [Elsteraceae bacterium]
MKLLYASAVALLLAGTSLTPALAQTPKDTVVMAKTIDDLISLDPAESFEFSGGEVLANTYDPLLLADPANGGKLTPILATSWEIGADGKTYTFKMKPGVKFHSGNPVTAEDAAYSIQRAVILNKTPGFILTQFGFTKDNVRDRVKATDPMTLVIQLEKAVAPSFFLNCMTANVALVVDSKLVKANEKDGDFGNGWLKTNEAGSGAFRMRGWKASESVSLEANKEWHLGAPLSNRVIIRHVVEPQARQLGVEKGDFDIVRDLGKDQLAVLRTKPGIKMIEGDRGYISYLAFNQKNPMLAKPEVFQALKLLIDYEGIERDLVRGTYKPHQTFLPKGFLGAIEDRPFKLDVAKAKELLAKAGVSDLKFTLDVRANQPFIDIAQSIQSTMAQGGVKIEIIQAEGRQVLTKYRARNHEIVLQSWGPDYFDPHTNAETFAMNEDNSDNARSKTLAWRNAWDIPDLTKRTQAAVLEQDTAKRTKIYEDLQREYLTIAPLAPMLQAIEVAVLRSNVDGFIVGGTYGSALFHKLKKN